MMKRHDGYDCVCVRCCKEVQEGEVEGMSSIYQSYDANFLCEPCFLEEDEFITEHGNNQPEILETYRQNMEAFRRRGYRPYICP